MSHLQDRLAAPGLTRRDSPTSITAPPVDDVAPDADGPFESPAIAAAVQYLAASRDDSYLSDAEARAVLAAERRQDRRRAPGCLAQQSGNVDGVTGAPVRSGLAEDGPPRTQEAPK